MLEIAPQYMILRGPMGVGKSTTCKNLFQYLNSVNIPRAVISFDVLRKYISDRELSYKNKKLCTKNIVSLSNNFIEEGYFTIIEGVIAEQELIDLLKTNITGNYKLFRLNCEKNVCYMRDKKTDRSFSCGEKNINNTFTIYEKNIIKNHEEIIIDNSRVTVDNVVELIVKNIKK